MPMAAVAIVVDSPKIASALSMDRRRRTTSRLDIQFSAQLKFGRPRAGALLI